MTTTYIVHNQRRCSWHTTTAEGETFADVAVTCGLPELSSRPGRRRPLEGPCGAHVPAGGPHHQRVCTAGVVYSTTGLAVSAVTCPYWSSDSVVFSNPHRRR
jgi:hypothetical protein